MSGALLLGAGAPARADLLAPLLELLRPQLETRLAAACERWASGGDDDLATRLRRPCAALAAPASRCLIEESQRGGSSLALIGELAGGRLGGKGEQVVKRCISRQLGLPADTLRDVPLRELAARWRGGSPRRMPPPEEPLQPEREPGPLLEGAMPSLQQPNQPRPAPPARERAMPAGPLEAQAGRRP
jgi:hypothetical protein